MSREKFHQNLSVDQSIIDHDRCSVPVILSVETDVVRYGWDDGKHFIKLLHGEENVDLTRKDILSIFINHETYALPIGKFENVRIEDRKLKADALFDPDDEESMKIFNKLAKGFLQSFSVGIDIHDRVLSKELDGVKYYDITSWSINEASVVGIPAIPDAKVGMSHDQSVAIPTAKSDKLANSEKRNNMDFSKENFDAVVLENSSLKTELEKVKLEATGIEEKHTAELAEAKTAEAKRIKDVEAVIPMAHKENEQVKEKLFDVSVGVNDMKSFLFDLNEKLAKDVKDIAEASAGAVSDEMLDIDSASTVLADDKDADGEALSAVNKMYKKGVK